MGSDALKRWVDKSPPRGEPRWAAPFRLMGLWRGRCGVSLRSRAAMYPVMFMPERLSLRHGSFTVAVKVASA
jgi:hypothetical protein